MLSTLVCLAATLPAVAEDLPRFRTICANGAVVLVERMPTEPMISVQLWASSKATRETKETHGYRHLLEHLLVKGRAKDLDRRLEQQGCFLHARTFRDSMQIEINVGPRQLDVAIKAINELLKPIEVNQEEIDREVSVMAQEFAIYDDGSRLSAGAWDQAYKEAGLDPFGNLEALKKATPEALKTIQRKQFYPENLALVIAGPVEIEEATKAAVAVVGAKQGANKTPDPPLADGASGRIEVDGFGEGRAAIVPGFDNPRTVSALAAAFAIASGFEGAFVTYTLSVTRGLVIVGQTERTSGVGIRIDEVREDELPGMFLTGRYLAKSWLQRQLQTARGTAALRGQLLCHGPGYRPEQMLDAINVMTYKQFEEGLRAFSKARAVTVVGR